MASSYGTSVGANVFFAARLHSYDWDIASAEDRDKSRVQASELIDQFDYLEQKYTVQQLSDNNPDADWSSDENQALLRQAELDQPLEFPRGESNVVPTEIETACYLIAKSLLSGRDPDADLESLSVKTSSYGGVRTVYDRAGNNPEHLSHLIPSPQAFNLIRPFFRERNTFDIKKVS